MSASAGKRGAIVWQMYNRGLFHEYTDVRIEEKPKEDKIITVK